MVLNCGDLLSQPPSGGSGGQRSERSEESGGSNSAIGEATSSLTIHNTRSARSIISGGRIASADEALAILKADSIAKEEEFVAEIQSLNIAEMDSMAIESIMAESQSDLLSAEELIAQAEPSIDNIPQESPLDVQSAIRQDNEKPLKERTPYFNDSMSYRRVVGTSILLPGFGQVHNKQAWKLPIIYGAAAGSALLLYNENKTYRPVKKEYEDYTYTVMERSDYLDELQAEYIRTSRRRNTYVSMIAATAIYALGDAAVNYSTKDVSPIRKATTLSAICPGAGQVYNRSYWKLPFIVGGITTMIFVYDWNNRGYVRFSKAYELVYEYEQNPSDYPDGSLDEFNGRYTSTYMKSLRDNYRRNRDLSIIIAVGLYVFQIIDANVDSHLKDFDISNDLTFNVNPLIDYAYLPSQGSNSAIYGLNFGINF